MKTKIKLKRNTESELYVLASEYKRLFGIANSISNESVLQTTGFKDWLSNVVMDTMNYEKLLLQIIKNDGYNYDFSSNGYIAEINSKPILSISETITFDMDQAYNYSIFINELGSDRKYQRMLSELKNDVQALYMKLFVAQSYQTEFNVFQAAKLDKLGNLSEFLDIPFIVGCYGYSNQNCYKQKVQMLEKFIEDNGEPFNCYDESYNDVNCRIYIPAKKKKLELKLTKRI